jgi:hydroxymethylpyrimidine pyrophosphatase-like HAD family hydrolase
MKPRVLALDFDGTIADDGRIDVDVVAAIQEARHAGLLVVLVTGRVLRDLDALLPSPAPFDAVVAENGAVLRLPTLPAPIPLCGPPDPHFLAELGRHRIRHQHGLCIVDADAEVAPEIVDIIRTLGLPLAITFNLSRLMVLPHGVNKASGLQEVFWRLRISAHNAIAVGNAENDHDMLAACEIGAAVAWGSEELKRRADEVVPGPPATSPDASGAPSGAIRHVGNGGAARFRGPGTQHPGRRRPEVGKIVDGRRSL